MFMQLHSNFTEDFKIKWIHYFFSGVYNHAVEQAVLKAHAVKAKIARLVGRRWGFEDCGFQIPTPWAF